MRKFLLALALLLISIASYAQSQPQSSAQPNAQPGTRAEILVLGTYHMGNPSHDIANIQADDVRSPLRQQQLAELMAMLKKFHPTKIAIEAEVGSKRVAQQYSDYLTGKYTLAQNEIDQVGYHLAEELGRKQVYSVDVDGDFPFTRVVNYAKANSIADKIDAMLAETRANAQANDDFLKSHTVIEMLQRVNSDAAVAKDLAWHYQCIRFSEPWEYAGPDLLASWYQRNIRIYSNIRKLADSPNERILVIYGYGHLALLRQFATEDPTVKLRKLDDLVDTPVVPQRQSWFRSSRGKA